VAVCAPTQDEAFRTRACVVLFKQIALEDEHWLSPDEPLDALEDGCCV